MPLLNLIRWQSEKYILLDWQAASYRIHINISMYSQQCKTCTATQNNTHRGYPNNRCQHFSVLNFIATLPYRIWHINASLNAPKPKWPRNAIMRFFRRLSNLCTLPTIRIHFDTLLYTSIRYDTLRYVTIHFDTLRYVTIHFDTVWYSLIHLTVCRCVTFAPLPSR